MSSGEAAGGLVAGVLGILFLIFLFVVGTLLYFLPTIIALVRRHPSGLLIGLINFLLGWSFVGWIVCLVWSFSGGRK